MFGISSRRKLRAVEKVLMRSHRGIHKLIDENRELMELLQNQAPFFLEKHSWVDGWLRSQDGFLVDLLSVFPYVKHLPFVGHPGFPRPWPEWKGGGAAIAPGARSTPGRWGLPDDIAFRISCGGNTVDAPWSFDQVMDFLKTCGIDPEKDALRVAGVLAGTEFLIGDGPVRFEQVRDQEPGLKWVDASIEAPPEDALFMVVADRDGRRLTGDLVTGFYADGGYFIGTTSAGDPLPGDLVVLFWTRVVWPDGFDESGIWQSRLMNSEVGVLA